jgi:hypothetical protein
MTDAERSRNYRRRHPERANAATKKWRKNNREKHKQLVLRWVSQHRERGYAARRKWKYGITDEQFQDKRIRQNNCCAICLKPFVKTPCVDHNHATNEVRDLLCQFCNALLGNAREDVFILERAIEYVKKYTETKMAEHEEKDETPKHAHHGFTDTHIRHHADGSHTMKHVHKDGSHKDVEHAVANLDGVHDSLEDHLGAPNAGESEANAGESGVPAAAPGGAGPGLPGGAPAVGAA